MNHAKTLVSLALIGLITATTACATTKVVSAEDYKQAISGAQASIKKAKSANYEWRDSGKILKKAKKAAKSGDFKKALKLVNKAKRQGELAYAQSIGQQNVTGPRL